MHYSITNATINDYTIVDVIIQEYLLEHNMMFVFVYIIVSRWKNCKKMKKTDYIRVHLYLKTLKFNESLTFFLKIWFCLLHLFDLKKMFL